jgi:hypothetical protein
MVNPQETGGQTKISKDTEAADLVKIIICVILKTFGHDCTPVVFGAYDL